MKKLILLLLAIGASSVCAYSAPVSQARARETAARFFGVSSSSPRMVAGGRATLSSTSLSSPAYYIFNNDGGGFVIVAVDDCLDPILAYSLTGKVDEASMPENLLFWLDGIRRSVNFLRRHDIP
ncbi:MAG: Spi family protease inhibitor, partial [Bacteroidales bacterium]|nr:Spi family protease inhibitor [Bacteroidales bacterium]